MSFNASAAIRRRFLVRLLANDVQGTALIEFAILLPILVLLFLGGYQLADAITCKRKVMITTRAVADLTSQYSSVSDGQIDRILGASTQIMAPYAAGNAQLRVTQVTTDALGVPKVSWSRGLRATALGTGSAFNLPLAMRIPNTSVIYAETVYNYEPGIAKLVGNVSYTQSLYMLPRLSRSVVYTS